MQNAGMGHDGTLCLLLDGAQNYVPLRRHFQDLTALGKIITSLVSEVVMCEVWRPI